MENTYYKQIFSITSGYVYQFSGSIPDGETPAEYITNEFVKESGDGQIHTCVTQLTNGKYVLHSFENIESQKFIQISDLSNDPPILPDPEPEEETEEQSQESQGGQ